MSGLANGHMTTPELLTYLFEHKHPARVSEFEAWLITSRRFKQFALDNRDKIRAKIRNARDDSVMQDLRAELEAAVLLLRAEKFTIEYEKYVAAKQRGPDYTVTWKTHTPFNVEVRRIRSVEGEQENAEAQVTKLMSVLCEKIGQLPPGIINLLWLTSEREIALPELQRALQMLQQFAEQRDQEFFTRRGFHSIAEFNKQFQRLSGILLHDANNNALWQNVNARHPLPREITTTLERLPQL